MTLKTEIAADTTAVFLDTDDFAETVTHRPADDSDNDTDVTVVFIEERRTDTKETNKGAKYVRNAVIWVASSVTVTKKDTWIHNSEKWQTVAEGRTQGGMKQVMVTRGEQIKTEADAKARMEW